MADVLIYTANFGAYDRVVAQTPQDIDVDWLCITDDHPDLEPIPEPWKHVVVDPAREHPNLGAKVYKAQPPFELGDWKYAIWIDANMWITDPRFAREAINCVNDGMATWRHPRRSCVYDEADASLGAESQGDRYENLPIREQMQSYRDEGYPRQHGLFASGTLVWTREAADTVGKAWLAECDKWGFQDQLALPVVCWRLGRSPGIFGPWQIERNFSARRGSEPYYLGNRWLRIWPHNREPYR